MPTYRVTDVADYLSGAWDLTRDIVAEDGARLGTFTGVGVFAPHDGVFAPHGDVLRFHEQGTLRMGDHDGTASRTLFYQPEGARRCTVWFEDGHYFHDLELDTGAWQVRHPCRADLYDGRFEVTGPDQWTQRWRVAGPEKAYTMSTLYTRRATDG